LAIPGMNPQSAGTDQEHLKLLTIFHYIVAGLHALFALIPLIHVLMGLFFALNPCMGEGGECMPPFFGWIFVAMGLGLILFGEAFAVGLYLNGRFIARRQHYLACVVISGVECVLFPFGTVLGIFSLMVLLRPTVKALFEAPPPPSSLIRG
jgi:hypothetical protein